MSTELVVISKEIIEELNYNDGAIAYGIKIVTGLAERNGQLLRDVKEKLPHGKFEQWVADNCKFSIRTAQNYMTAINATVALMPNQPEVPVFTQLAALASANIRAAKVVKMLADTNITLPKEELARLKLAPKFNGSTYECKRGMEWWLNPNTGLPQQRTKCPGAEGHEPNEYWFHDLSWKWRQVHPDTDKWLKSKVDVPPAVETEEQKVAREAKEAAARAIDSEKWLRVELSEFLDVGLPATIKLVKQLFSSAYNLDNPKVNSEPEYLAIVNAHIDNLKGELK